MKKVRTTTQVAAPMPRLCFQRTEKKRLNEVHRGAFICSRGRFAARLRGNLVANVDSHDGVRAGDLTLLG